MRQEEQVMPRSSLEVLGLVKGSVSLLFGNAPMRRDRGLQATGRCDDSGGTIACGIAKVASKGLNFPEDADSPESLRVRVMMFITDEYLEMSGRACPYHESLYDTDPRWLMIVENGLPAPVEAVARTARESGIGLIVFNPIAGPSERIAEAIHSLNVLAWRSDAAVLAVRELNNDEFDAVTRADIPSELLDLTTTILVAQSLPPYDDDLEMLSDPHLGWCPARGALSKIDSATRGVKHLANVTVDEAGVSFWSPFGRRL